MSCLNDDKSFAKAWVIEAMATLAIYFTVVVTSPDQRSLLVDLALCFFALVLASRFVIGFLSERVRSTGRVATLRARWSV